MNMSGPVDRLKRILVGNIHGGIPAVYVATTVEDTALITDVYTFVDGVFRNVTFSNESGTSVQTMRNYYVYADDIDNDGVVELPCLINMVPVYQSQQQDSRYLVRWYAMTADGSEVDKRYTYHDFGGGWYLELSSQGASRISVAQQGNQYTFYLWDETYERCVKLLSLWSFTGQDRQTQATSEGRFVVYSSESVTYAAQLTSDATDYSVTENMVIDNFHLIHQDWKTGET